jgi:hypothetical protein
MTTAQSLLVTRHLQRQSVAILPKPACICCSDERDRNTGALQPPARAVPTAIGAFYRSELYAIAARIDEHLARWAMQKFKRLRGRPDRAWRWLDAARLRQPKLFAHWHLLTSPTRRTVGAV